MIYLLGSGISTTLNIKALDLRQAMDQYSIFAGRNVLVSITVLTQNLLTHYVRY